MLPELLREIGADRSLEKADVQPRPDERPFLDAAWRVYVTQFQSFTGSTLDPGFEAFSHPAVRYGSPCLDAGTTVVVVGTGPSLETNLGALTRVRRQVRIFTSPRGAETLLGHGIVPDLVLVEHRTALDAHHSARHVGDRPDAVLAACPLVAAEWKTPSALLAGVSPGSLFVPTAASFGLWPATAVAMAMDGGASCVALLGVDLGTRRAPDAGQAPLSSLLTLLAQASRVPTLDCGLIGARKDGWVARALDVAAGTAVHGACQVTTSPAPDAKERLIRARIEFDELRPIVERARHLSRLAMEGRAGGLPNPELVLADAVQEIMAWRRDRRARALVQERLGAALLPRLWRIGIDITLGRALWRPLMLATHEIVGQADAFTSLTSMEKAA